MQRIKKTMTLAGIAILILVTLYYVVVKPGGGERLVPYGQLRNSRLHAEVNKQLNAEEQPLEDQYKNTNDRNAHRRIGQQIIAQEGAAHADHFALDHVVKSCPANNKPEPESHKFSFDISGCASGQFTGIPLLDPWEEQIYSVRLYKFGQNGELVPISIVPKIEPADRSIHTEAQNLGSSVIVSPSRDSAIFATRYQLRGDVKIVPDGRADYVEFVRE